MVASLLTALGAAVVPASTAVLLLAALLLVGYSLLPVRLGRASGRWTAPLALAVGALATGWVTFVVGSLISTRAGVAAAMLLMLQGLRAAPRGWAGLRGCGRHLTSLVRAGPVAATATGLLLLALLPQLAIPIVDSDGLRYHLALPKLYLLSGHIQFYPFDVTGAFPQTAEMLYLLGLFAAGGAVAKWLHAGFFVATLATLALTVHSGRRSRTAAMLAPLLLAASPVVLAPAGAAFVDHVSLFGIAAAALLVVRRRSPLAGWPLALAVAAKLTSAPAVAALGLAALVSAGPGRRWRTLGWLAAPVALAWAPFALRNVVHTGDPFFPVGYGLVGRAVPGLRDGAHEFAVRYHADVPGYLGIAWGQSTARQPDEVVGWHHLLGLIAVVVALRQRRARTWVLLIVAYAWLGMWFRPPSRYLLPALWGLAACEALALGRLSRRWAQTLTLVAVAPAAWWAVEVSSQASRPWDYLLGREERAAYLARAVPGWRAARVASEVAGEGRVMALDFPAAYYLDRPWIIEGVLNEPPLLTWVRQARTAWELLARLEAGRVSVLVVTPGYGGGTPRSLQVLGTNVREVQVLGELRRRLELVTTLDGVDVYRVPQLDIRSAARRTVDQTTPEAAAAPPSAPRREPTIR
ncbi:MAG TPA: hypothetical protein PKL08_06125 [Thermoanaerobaculaceae bacterium]|nr:hypothetical protein [Thermoanaerobaculaceae bacterium]